MKRPLRTGLSTKNMSARGIPNHFFETSITDFQTGDSIYLKRAKSTVSNYIEHFDEMLHNGNGLFLCGSNGVGKSMLASIIVKEAYRARYSSRRITFVEYIDAYTKIWKAKSVEEKESMEDEFYSYIKAVDFLALEEIGKEHTQRDLAVTILEDCLRYREEHGLCTIICTNLSFNDLMKRYGSKSIESLIKGHMEPLTLVGIDRRVNGEEW